tara:strand:+ start:1579 stop:1881 length:303 start_codon:yes stop_codon:yes gene_type:complete
MRLKPGVRIRGLRPEAWFAFYVADQVYMELSAEAVMTSGVEGRHSHGSIHYAGGAFDLRISNIPGAEQLARDRLAERIGADFDVVLEGNHIHVEYQPKVE